MTSATPRRLWHRKSPPSHLAVEGQVTASAQSQALSALLFLYRYVLQIDLDESIAFVRAKKPRRLPTVLTKAEVQAVLRHLAGEYLLMAQLRTAVVYA